MTRRVGLSVGLPLAVLALPGAAEAHSETVAVVWNSPAYHPASATLTNTLTSRAAH